MHDPQRPPSSSAPPAASAARSRQALARRGWRIRALAPRTRAGRPRRLEWVRGDAMNAADVTAPPPAPR